MTNKSLWLILLYSCVTLSFLISCNGYANQYEEIKKLPSQELIEIVNNQGGGYLDAIEELGMRPEDSAISAQALARAMQNPRRDSYFPGIALARLGPSAKAAIPDLQSALSNDYQETRAYAAFALGNIGEASKCAVPDLALLLWDPDGKVRTAAAWAIESITGTELLEENDKLDIKFPYIISIDDPEGSIVGKARIWWDQIGKLMTWPERCNI